MDDTLLKKNRRIRSNKDFQLVFKKGDSFANRQFVLYFLKKENQSRFRIGLSVSTKVGNAVKRNQIKRYLKQAFFEINDQVKNDYDLVIIARNPAATLDFFETKKSLLHLLMKTDLLVKNRKSVSLIEK